MKRMVTVVALVVVAAWLVLMPVGAVKSAADDKVTEELTKLEHSWAEAFVKRDTAFVEKVLADDYVFTGPDGTVNDKKGDINALKEGIVAFDEMKMSALKVQVYGNTAIVTGVAAIKGKVAGQDATGNYRFTDVFVKIDGQYKCVAAQVTRVTKQ